jgi:hypothetical protein
MRSRAAIRAEALVIVFARAPVPGQVKTRLVPVLGARGAASLYARLAERTVRVARAARIGPVELHCAPSAAHPFFRRFAERKRVQKGADLGERMYRALRHGLRRHRAVLLVGSDCPVLRAAHLRRAAQWLRDGVDAVFAPTRDGGYALIGLSRISCKLFRNIPWGSRRVMARTRARLRRLGWRWRALPRLWDVDRPEDALRMARTLRVTL